jgi:hypothetical protein
MSCSPSPEHSSGVEVVNLEQESPGVAVVDLVQESSGVEVVDLVQESSRFEVVDLVQESSGVEVVDIEQEHLTPPYVYEQPLIHEFPCSSPFTMTGHDQYICLPRNGQLHLPNIVHVTLY